MLFFIVVCRIIISSVLLFLYHIRVVVCVIRMLICVSLYVYMLSYVCVSSFAYVFLLHVALFFVRMFILFCVYCVVFCLIRRLILFSYICRYVFHIQTRVCLVR